MSETTDESKQGKHTNDDSAGKEASSGLSKAVAQIGQSGLALLLIVPAFILIGYMLVMQATTVDSAINGINTIAGIPTTPNRAAPSSAAASSNTSTSTTTPATTTTSIDQSTTNTIREMSTFYQQINASNQNMFSIILTVFGTWVGAVVAFYFGTQNLRQSQESFNKVGQVLDNTISKMSQGPQAPKVTHKTVGELLEENPTAKKVVTVNIGETIKDVKMKFTNNPVDPNISNVVVLERDPDQEETVIRGILYKSDLIEQIGAKFEGADPLDNTPLKEVITNIKNDSVTHTEWKTSEDIYQENFVELKKDATIEDAKNEMNAKGNELIRGIVAGPDKIEGIIDYQML